ncbi:VWA domain-containing protein [Candidatus Woesearchaeota archaeon]|nr:VWA domain-containing protein [Candidatus Woesearchaeota archaeon]
MGDIAKDRLRKLLGDTATPETGGKALPPGAGADALRATLLGPNAVKALPPGTDHAATYQKAVVEAPSPLDVYFSFDTTGSMYAVIREVRNVTREVGAVIFSREKDTRARIIGVGDHCDTRYLMHLLVQQKLGDYGQIHPFTSRADQLEAQIAGIVNTSGGDTPEAYGDFFLDTAELIMGERRPGEKKKHVVAFFGDAYSHEANICPRSIDPRQSSAALLGAADHVFFVGCNSYGDTFKRQTYELARGSPKATYVEFSAARDVLPEAITGMIERERGAVAYRTFLDNLRTLPSGAEKAEKVAGLLGDGKGR